MKFHKRVFLLTSLLLLFAVLLMPLSAHAQDDPANPVLPAHGYFLAADDAGILQVWRYHADGSAPEIITAAAQPIVDFAVAYDALSVVYTSEQALWLKPLDTDSAAFKLADLQTAFPAAPVFSPDNRYLAYANNGLWISELNGAAPRQLIANIALEAGGPADYRFYQPLRFIPNTNQLIVRIGFWEGISFGVLDLDSGVLTPYAEQVHTSALPLRDGRILVYGNDMMRGDFTVQAAPDSTLTNLETVLDLRTITADYTLFVRFAAEREDGIIRFAGEGFSNNAPETMGFVFDYDLNTGAVVGELQVFPLANVSPMEQTIIGGLVGNGDLIFIYTKAQVMTDLNSAGMIMGTLSFYEVASGEITSLTSPTMVALFHYPHAQ